MAGQRHSVGHLQTPKSWAADSDNGFKVRCLSVINGCRVGRIPNPENQLFLRCTNCRVLFPSEVRLPPNAFEGAVIEDRTYKCPVCANFDTYSKSDLFYDRDPGVT